MLKAYLKKHYLGFEKDFFSVFMVRNLTLTRKTGQLGFMTPFVWMFISSFENLRNHISNNSTLTSLIQPELHAFFDSAFVSLCVFTINATKIESYKSSFIRLTDFYGADVQPIKTLEAIRNKSCGWFFEAKPDDFKKIPGSPIAYWVSENFRKVFEKGRPLGEIAEPRQGMATGENNRFLRFWAEIALGNFGVNLKSREEAIGSKRKWFPYNKGGEYRRWYGNNQYLVNWENDGIEIRNFTDETGYLRSRPQGLDFIFRPALTWSFISSSFFAVRCSDAGFLFDVAGSSAFPPDEWRECIAGFLCSSIAFDMMKVMNPTMNFQVGNVAALPILKEKVLAQKETIDAVVRQAVQIARNDWDSFETSWDFKKLPVLQQPAQTLAKSQEAADIECLARFAQMKRLEEENNRLFINAYGLQDELSPDVPDDQITLHRPNRAQDIKRLISYAIGCMMGRYSLDKEGLIYAHSGNEDFKKIYTTTDNTDSPDKKENPDSSSSVVKFLPDEDGIVPLLNTDWGIADDATNRIVEFVNVCWNGEPDASSSMASVLSVVKSSPQLEENLKFIAESLGASPDALPRDVIRKYLSSDFYKSHLQMYKRRPIYWLFSSGKLKAFQCLVYLHRYNEGTLSRMRTEYVIPLLGRLSARIEQLEADKLKSSSTSQRKKLQKEQDDFKKQQSELMTFDERLKNYADQKIKLDLDDGVKVNYAKFADILAEVKAVTGGIEE